MQQSIISSKKGSIIVLITKINILPTNKLKEIIKITCFCEKNRLKNAKLDQQDKIHLTRLAKMP